MAKKSYSNEFKKKVAYNSVQNVLHNASSYEEEAKKAGVGGSTLHKWRKLFIDPHTNELIEESTSNQLELNSAKLPLIANSGSNEEEYALFGPEFLTIKTKDPRLKQKIAAAFAEVLQENI